MHNDNLHKINKYLLIRSNVPLHCFAINPADDYPSTPFDQNSFSSLLFAATSSPFVFKDTPICVASLISASKTPKKHKPNKAKGKK